MTKEQKDFISFMKSFILEQTEVIQDCFESPQPIHSAFRNGLINSIGNSAKVSKGVGIRILMKYLEINKIKDIDYDYKKWNQEVKELLESCNLDPKESLL